MSGILWCDFSGGRGVPKLSFSSGWFIRAIDLHNWQEGGSREEAGSRKQGGRRKEEAGRTWHEQEMGNGKLNRTGAAFMVSSKIWCANWNRWYLTSSSSSMVVNSRSTKRKRNPETPRKKDREKEKKKGNKRKWAHRSSKDQSNQHSSKASHANELLVFRLVPVEQSPSLVVMESQFPLSFFLSFFLSFLFLSSYFLFLILISCLFHFRLTSLLTAPSSSHRLICITLLISARCHSSPATRANP